MILEALTTNGFCVVKNLIDDEGCDSLVASAQQEITPYQLPLLRQATACEEVHKLSKRGFILNPLWQIHRLEKEEFTTFRSSLYAILANSGIQGPLTEIYGSEPVLASSMYFESTTMGTLAHVDTPYIDSDPTGGLICCWIALEDIIEAAGRFFIYPQSHLLETDRFDSRVREDHSEFLRLLHLETQACSSEEFTKFFLRRQKALRTLVKNSGLQIYTPEILKGDVIFFFGRTIHGSHLPKDIELTRRSLSLHFIPRSKGVKLKGVLQPSLDCRRTEGILVI